MKSPAQRLAVAPLENIQGTWLREYEADLRQYESDLAEFERQSKTKRNPDSETPTPPPRPILRRCVMGDTTIEAVAPILQENPRGLLVSRDELGTWLGSFCRYKGKADGSDLANWLSLWQAQRIVVDRKTGRAVIYCPPAGASLCGGIQPNILARYLTPEFFESGLSARLLLAMPSPPPKHWTECEIDPDTEAAYRKLILYLLALEFGAYVEGEPRPVRLKLSPAAKRLWVEYYNVGAVAQHEAADDGLAAAPAD